MYKKIWKEEQLHDFYVPSEVKQRIQELIEVLCFYYGEERNVDMELGGFIAAFTDDSPFDMQEYQELINTLYTCSVIESYIVIETIKDNVFNPRETKA